jgi:hypothetical protein
MSRIIHGQKYMLIDVVVINGIIYDIYENEQGHKVKIACDYVRE